MDALPGLLVQFMFAYVENTFFSPIWWRSLAEEDRSHVGALARMPNAYYTGFSYVPRQLVPWQVSDAHIEEAA